MDAGLLNFVNVLGNTNSARLENFSAVFVEIQTFPPAIYLVTIYQPKQRCVLEDMIVHRMKT
jgi:hypothetical protein